MTAIQAPTAPLPTDSIPASAEPATTLPVLDHSAEPATLRPLGGVSPDGVLNVAGALVSAVSITFLLFGRLTPLSGGLGFVLVAFGLFLVTYAAMVSFTEQRPVVVDKLVTALLVSAAATALLALFSVILFTLWRGRAALTKTNLYWQDMSEAGPLDPLSKGGISHAIVGTLIIISIAIVLTVPLGLTCAVFINETRSRLGTVVRTVVDAMTALPSILAGLFILATWIRILGFERSAVAAAIAVSIMMLPIVIRSADVVLRLVPGNLREAAGALGAPQWRTVRHVVLPTARSGLATSVILGVARGVGETAPVLLTAGFASSLNVNPTKNSMVSLPLAAFEFVRSPQPALIARGFATAAVLMVVVLVLFCLARLVGGRPAGTITRRQADRAARRSARDAGRFESRQPQKEPTSPELVTQ